MPRSRPATYRTAVRLLRVLHGLLDRPWGWSFDGIENELRVSQRTLARYVGAFRDFVDEDGRPIIEVFRRGDRRFLRLAASVRTPESSSYQALSFYFALTVFQFLDGTVLKDGVEDLWRRFLERIPRDQRPRLADFDRKFFSIPYAVKDYRAFDDRIDVVLQCLVHQHVMHVEYRSPWRGGDERTVHDFAPYTLVMYRGGLYLIGRSEQLGRVVYLAVERIESATKLPARFDYPKRYSPAKHTEGMFGIVDGPETHVVLRLLRPEGAALLSSRRLHPTQRFEPQPDGTTLLTMTVRGTSELANWILSLGSHVEVRAPDALRAEVARAHEEAARLYRT